VGIISSHFTNTLGRLRATLQASHIDLCPVRIEVKPSQKEKKSSGNFHPTRTPLFSHLPVVEVDYDDLCIRYNSQHTADFDSVKCLDDRAGAKTLLAAEYPPGAPLAVGRGSGAAVSVVAAAVSVVVASGGGGEVELTSCGRVLVGAGHGGSRLGGLSSSTSLTQR
jgi:hypothetical protein